MPAVRVRHHFLVGEAAHFLAHRFQRFVEAVVADAALRLLDEVDQLGAYRCRGAFRDQRFDGARPALLDFIVGKPEGGEPHDLALAHRNAAEDLRERLAKADGDEQALGFTEAAGFKHAPGIGGKLADDLDIGREPREAVRGVLFALQKLCGNFAARRNAPLDGGGGVGQQGADRVFGFRGEAEKAGFCR